MTATTSHRKQRLRKNPYEKLHNKLLTFAANAELDPDLTSRNEFLHLENMILRGLYFERNERLKFTDAEKEELALSAAKVRGRSSVKASLLSPAQIVRFSKKSLGQKYVSLFPKAKNPVRVKKRSKEEVLLEIIETHPRWTKKQVWEEMEKYFPNIPAFQVYDMLYDVGYWDAKPVVRGIPWKEFLKRFEKVTWAGDFFTTDVWTDHGQWTYYTLFFIHLETQRVFLAGTTPHCTSEWLIQTLKWWSGGFDTPFGPDARFLIRDRDRRYTEEVDWYFMQMGLMPKVISPGAPVMNYHAEQFVRKIKHECLSHCLFLSGQALRKVLDAYVEYYSTQRPNTRFNGGCIIEDSTHWQSEGEIKKFSQLPGLLNYYYRDNVGQ